MAIGCAHCGGAHDTPAEVRACWQGGASGRAAAASPSPASPEPGQPVADRTARPLAAEADGRRAGAAQLPSWMPRLPGPDALGRSVVVVARGAAPAAWNKAPTITVGDAELADPGKVLVALRAARRERRRVVVELTGTAVDALDPENRPAEAEAEPARVVGAQFAFHRDELWHLVWSHSVDGRDRPDTDEPSADSSLPAPSPGDAQLADGTHVWIDGGPLRYLPPIDGVPVVHRVAYDTLGGDAQVPVDNVTDADLAPDQLAAVTHDGGVARIIAPAGSGKTRVLTERARHVLQRWRLPASAVTLVAFNKRAQEEMTQRTADLPGLQVRTLNSIALAIVNGSAPFAPQPRRWTTIDEPQVRGIIGDLVSFPRRRNSDPVAPWIEALGAIRLQLADPIEVEARYDGDVDGLAAMWPTYDALLERRGMVDFDGQIDRALRVLLSDPTARHAAQRACRVMLVDEFQDLTPAHVLMIRLLAAPDGAVFGVGDDDQTIYGYNGADPGWLIDFADWFPGAASHPLEVNYRCPPEIVSAVDNLLQYNRRRVAKEIRAARAPVEGAGWQVETSADSVGATQRTVANALESGTTPNEVAVLTRVNSLLAPVQAALTVAGIDVRGGVGLEFLDRTAVRAVLAWLRLASSAPGRGRHRRAGRRFDPDDLREALRRPSRSFHPRINDWICEQGDIVELFKLASRLNNERDATRLEEFAADVQLLSDMVADGASCAELVLALVERVGLAGSIETLDAHRRGMNRAAQGDDLTAVVQLASVFDDIDVGDADAEHPLATRFVRWARDVLAVGRTADGVTLSTVHRVKGQEWPVVVVHEASAAQYPHRLSEDVEEERRLFHVALTRAASLATIVTGAQPSGFVGELTSPPPAHEANAPTGASDRSSRSSRSSARSAAPSASDTPEHAARVDALRALRNELRDGKPAYVVFDNATMEEIARRWPATEGDLRRIPGIGPAKLERYGPAVLELIADHP
ncbi:MAG: ATP-dependent DNA helicase UvrD2 [Actinomycetota bacterium]